MRLENVNFSDHCGFSRRRGSWLGWGGFVRLRGGCGGGGGGTGALAVVEEYVDVEVGGLGSFGLVLVQLG